MACSAMGIVLAAPCPRGCFGRTVSGQQGSMTVIGGDRVGRCCLVALSRLGMAGGSMHFGADFEPLRRARATGACCAWTG